MRKKFKQENQGQLGLFAKDTAEDKKQTVPKTTLPKARPKIFESKPFECAFCGLYPDGRLRCVTDLSLCPPEDKLCSDFRLGKCKVLSIQDLILQRRKDSGRQNISPGV